MATGAGVLTIGDYLGGPDNIQYEKIFPKNQKTLNFDFGQDVSGWTFEADYQTLVVNPVSFNRYTGAPNFANSNVIGYFPLVEVTSPYLPEIINSTLGLVNVYVPALMYDGNILPDQRQNVPITIFSFTWTTNDAIPTIETTRWAFIQSWEPDVTIGDPTLESAYVAVTLGA